MRRYKYLTQKDALETLRKVEDAFLAAKDGNQVNKIIDGLLTYDEKLKIGRRILIAECLRVHMSIEEISHILKVGRNTIMHVSRRLEKYDEWFELIEKRSKTTKDEYQRRKKKSIGASNLIFKKKINTNFKRADVKRG